MSFVRLLSHKDLIWIAVYPVLALEIPYHLAARSNNLRCPLHLRMIFSKNVFCGAISPRREPDITARGQGWKDGAPSMHDVKRLRPQTEISPKALTSHTRFHSRKRRGKQRGRERGPAGREEKGTWLFRCQASCAGVGKRKGRCSDRLPPSSTRVQLSLSWAQALSLCVWHGVWVRALAVRALERLPWVRQTRCTIGGALPTSRYCSLSDKTDKSKEETFGRAIQTFAFTSSSGEEKGIVYRKFYETWKQGETL